MKKKKAVYRPKLCGVLLEYFSRESGVTRAEVQYHPNGEIKQEKPVREPCELPTFEGFCWETGLSMETLQRWEEEHEAFREACKRARARQRQLLIAGALLGDYNATFAKFLACSLCGMSPAAAEAPQQLPRLIDDL